VTDAIVWPLPVLRNTADAVFFGAASVSRSVQPTQAQGQNRWAADA
jgi:hypothetical protein